MHVLPLYRTMLPEFPAADAGRLARCTGIRSGDRLGMSRRATAAARHTGGCSRCRRAWGIEPLVAERRRTAPTRALGLSPSSGLTGNESENASRNGDGYGGKNATPGRLARVGGTPARTRQMAPASKGCRSRSSSPGRGAVGSRMETAGPRHVPHEQGTGPSTVLHIAHHNSGMAP